MINNGKKNTKLNTLIPSQYFFKTKSTTGMATNEKSMMLLIKASLAFFSLYWNSFDTIKLKMLLGKLHHYGGKALS